MAAGNDTVNIKVKYIPDTSALKNIKEIRVPEIKVGGKDAGKGVFDSYNNAIRDLNRELSKGTDASAITKAFKIVGEETTKVKIQINSIKEAINQSFQSPSNQSLIKDYQNLEKQLKKLDVESQKRRKKSAELSSFKSQNNMSTPQARKEISKAEALVTAGEKLTKQDQERLEIAKQIVAKEEELAKLRTQEEIRNAQKDVKNQMSDSKYDPMISSTETNRALEQYNDILSQVGTNSSKATEEGSRFNTFLGEQASEAKKAKKEVMEFGNIFAGTFLGTTLNQLVRTGIDRGVEFFKEYDEILTRTMMVTGMTRGEVNELTSSYNKLANQLSSTTKDVAAAQLVFYQQGLGTSEALKMTEASIAISKTGGIAAAEAANRLTAAVRGYKMAANDALLIADKMSALDAAAASSVDELTIAMQKSASQARMAGLDLDYYMAYLSTMQEVTREAPENIGTAMKSITSRLQEIKDIGKIEEDGTTFSNVAKALNSVGIAAIDSSGQLRSLQDIMNELGPMWATLDKNHKAYIATVLAGNRQQSRFIALMDNYDRAMELVGVSQNASGESAKQLRAYNQGLEASFTKLTNAWQQFATKVTDSSAITNLVNNLTKLIEKINEFPTPLVRAVSGLWALNKAVKTYSALKTVFSGGAVSKIKEVFGFTEEDTKGLSKGVKGLGDIFKNFYGVLKKAGQEFKNYGKTVGSVDKNISDSETVVKSHRAAVEESSVSIEKEAALQKGNNSIKKEESQENEIITDSQKDLEKAIKKTSKALIEQDSIYSGNGPEKLKELEDNHRRLTKELEGLQLQRDLKVKENRNIVEAWKTEEKSARDAYEKAVDITELRKRAIEEIQGEGTDLGTEQLSIFGLGTFSPKSEKLIQKKMNELKKGYGIWYNTEQERLRDSALKSLEPNNTYIEELDKSIKDSKKKIKESKNKLNKFKKEIEEKDKDKDKQPDKEETPKDLPNEKPTDDSKSALIGAFSTGVIANMAAQMVGLNEELSKGIGLAVGFSKAGYSFGKGWGLAAGAIIGVSIALAQYLFPSVDTVQKRMNEILTKKDELDQKFSDINTNLKVYEELSKKLIRTDEETQQLTDSTAALAKALPDAVAGYDELGNAIIDTSLALETLNKMADQRQVLAGRNLEQYGDLQKAEATSKKIKGIGKTILGIGAAIVGVLGVIAAIPTGGASLAATAAAITSTAGGVAAAGTGLALWGTYDVITAKDQGEENARILKENYSDIYAGMQDYVEKMVKQGDPKYEKIRQQLSDQINSTLISGTIKKKGDATKMVDNLKDYYEKLGSTGLNAVARQIEQVAENEDLDNLSYGKLKKTLEDNLTETLKSFNLSTEEIDLAIDGAINVVWKGRIDIKDLKEKIKASIKDKKNYGNLTKGEYEETANQFIKDLDDLNPQIIALLNSVDLLDSSFIQLYRDAIGGQEQLTQMFKDGEGKINKNVGAVNLLNSLYKNSEYSNAEREEIAKKREELKKQLEELEEQRKNSSMVFMNNDFGYKSKGDEKFGSIQNNEQYQPETAFEKRIKNIKAEIAKYDEEIDKTTQHSEEMIQKIDKISSMLDGWDVPTFSKIAEDVEKAVNEIVSLDDIIKTLQETGGKITLDQFTGLFNMLDALEEAMYADQDSMEMYGQAFQRLADSIDYVNGELLIQADGVKAIEEVKAAAFSASMKRQSQEIQGEIDKMEMEKALLQAQIDALQAGIDASEKGEDAETAIETSLNSSLETIFNGRLGMESDYAAKSLAISSQFLKKTADIYSKMKKVMAFEDVDISTEDMNFDFKEEIKDRTKELGKDKKDGKFNVKVAEEQIAALKKQIGNIDKTIGVLNSKKKVVDAFAKMDTKGLAAFGNREAQKNADEYIGKLKITFSLLQQIERLQHQININARRQNLYKDVDGKKYADSMITELDLMQKQYAVRKELFEMQKKELGKQMGKIQDSPYSSLFSFADNGLIQLNWEAYHAMPGEMQEEVDELVEDYETLQDEVENTEEVLYDYADAIKKNWEQVENTIIKAENEIVNALKNREKILHNARTKALDDEIKMIEKAVEARKKAQDKDKSNKELYKAQEALRRATLDSSGKNNAQLLQLQQDLEDKQLEIAEKRFEDDMDDRKQWLQDTKDAETETYEYRLEKMTWYWEQAQMISEAGTDAIMNFLIAWDEKYQSESDTSKKQIERGWRTMYEQIQQLYDKGFDLTTFHNQMTDVTKDLENQKIRIEAIATAWKSVASAAKEASSASYGGGGRSYPKNRTEKPKKDDKTTKSNPAPSPAAVPKEPGNLTAYRLKNNKLENTYTCAMPSEYDEGAVPLSIGATFRDKNGKSYYKGKDGFMYLASDFKKVYKSGGYVDYTGPAWVDGNKPHPEAFLSAYQTEQIGALAKSLDPSTVNNATTNSNVTFGSINFNVASMSSAADGKKALDIFVQGANDMMAKKGIGTKLNINMK